MTKWDKEYIKLCSKILDEGVRVQNRTGIDTIKIPSYHLHFDLSEEFPVLATKQLFFRQAIIEMLWIYQAQSNDVRWLQERNVHIWDEWEIDEEGLWKATQNVIENGKYVKKEVVRKFPKEYAHTIGTAYGWIVKEFHQIDTLIEQLKTNPQNRRMIINLWQIPYLDTGALYPCVFNSCWDVTDGKLNCMLTIRSNDLPLGNPFNVVQYAVLVHLLAQVTGYKPGLLTVCISNAHIYENQIEGMKEHLSRRDKALPAPKLWINPEIKDFYKFTIDDIKLEGYEHLGKIEMPVSV